MSRHKLKRRSFDLLEIADIHFASTRLVHHVMVVSVSPVPITDLPSASFAVWVDVGSVHPCAIRVSETFAKAVDYHALVAIAGTVLIAIHVLNANDCNAMKDIVDISLVISVVFICVMSVCDSVHGA
jgi:hypothetical protein